MSTLDDGSGGSVGLFRPFTEWVNSTGTCCAPHLINNFTVHQWDQVSVNLIFEGDTTGLTTAPKGESKHDSGNYSSAGFYDTTAGTETVYLFAYGAHWSDGSLDWVFEDTSYPDLNNCNGNICQYLPQEFEEDYATRVNLATDELKDLTKDRNYIAPLNDSQHLWVCPLPVQAGNWWFTEMGHYTGACS